MNNTIKYDVKNLRNGSVDAFEKVYNYYSGSLFNYLLKISNGDRYMAEEIVQSVFVKIWETKDQIDLEKTFFSYLCTISKNILLNSYRQKTISYIYHEFVMQESSELDFSTEKGIENKILEEYIDTLIEYLPPSRKKIFILNYKHYLSNKDIARQLNLSESTIEKQLAAARLFLRKQLLLHYDKLFSIIVAFLNLR